MEHLDNARSEIGEFVDEVLELLVRRARPGAGRPFRVA